ncbi:MAG: hypothetical protein AABW56_04845 [Nanoarchaeota archaeon]
MKLIRKLGTRLSKGGHFISWAVFECPDCLQLVEKQLSHGKRDKSCGCTQYIKNKANFRHGMEGTKLYNKWKNMKSRCLNPNNKDYQNYGGRGITICNEWLEFIPFRDWSLSNGYIEDLEIHRVNDGNYEPGSCKWVTRTENMRDTRGNVIKNIEMANKIRYLDSTGKYTRKILAIRYNVSTSIINQIINNKIWKNT